MAHAVMAEIEPGDVVVLTMPEPAPVALVGELLATQARRRGAAALLVDAAVRDVEELARLGLPIWARWIRIRGATKTASARSASRWRSAARDPRRATRSCSTPTAPRSSPRRASARCSRRARARAEKERVKRAALEAGALSYDLDGLGPRREPLMAIPPTSPTSITPSCSRRSRTRASASSSTCSGWRSSRGGRVGLPARLGRLRALQPEAVRGRHRDRAPCDPARGARRRSTGSAAIDATGRGQGWIDGDHGHGPAYRFTDPDGHVFELLYEADRYEPPPGLAPVAEEPAAAVRRPRGRRQAARPRQPARRGRSRRPRIRRRRARVPALRARGARRRHRDGRLDEPQRSRPTS